ncbi:hypothetical protein CBS101457_004452 [Exobasidium rhododendri]|nr:hypothetical protein CBS101457_004452 [Exobasidium rhododendri]
MSYLYHIAAWSTLLVIFAIVVYFARYRLYAILPERLQTVLIKSAGGGNASLYSRLPAYDWSTSRIAGLHSTLFDIESNIQNGDSRTGLEASGAQEIERLMNTQGVDFDTARLMVNQARFSKNNIDPITGMPLDRKAVTFENLR